MKDRFRGRLRASQLDRNRVDRPELFSHKEWGWRERFAHTVCVVAKREPLLRVIFGFGIEVQIHDSQQRLSLPFTYISNANALQTIVPRNLCRNCLNYDYTIL